MVVGDFELIKEKGKWWRDKVTNGIIYCRGYWVYALRNEDSNGKYCNEELVDTSNLIFSHVNFKRNVTSNLIEGIRINNTSKNMLIAGSIIDRYIKQVFDTSNLRDSQ